MKNIFLTITGTKYYFGNNIFYIGQKLFCKKDPDNQYDKKAISVLIENVGKAGYIANSPYTVIYGTKSSSQIYKKVKNNFYIKVMFITENGVICKVVDGIKEKKEKFIEHIVIDNNEVNI